VSAVFYRFQWEVTEGQPQLHRDLILLLDHSRLVGWYNVSGSTGDFATARFDGTFLSLPSGIRMVVWPPPPILVEPAQGTDEVEQRYLFHSSTTSGAK